MTSLSGMVAQSILNKPVDKKLTKPRTGPRKMPKTKIPAKKALTMPKDGPRRMKNGPAAKTPRMRK
jgi:hypothetical protein